MVWLRRIGPPGIKAHLVEMSKILPVEVASLRIEDIAQAAASVEGAIDEFASTESLKSFLLKYSDRAYSEYWYRKGELATINADIDNFAFSGAKGVSKVFNANNTYYAAMARGGRHLQFRLPL